MGPTEYQALLDWLHAAAVWEEHGIVGADTNTRYEFPEGCDGMYYISFVGAVFVFDSEQDFYVAVYYSAAPKTEWRLPF